MLSKQNRCLYGELTSWREEAGGALINRAQKIRTLSTTIKIYTKWYRHYEIRQYEGLLWSVPLHVKLTGGKYYPRSCQRQTCMYSLT